MEIGFWTQIKPIDPSFFATIYYWTWEKPITIKDRTYFYLMGFVADIGFTLNSWNMDLSEKYNEIPESQVPEFIREEQQNKFNDPLFELEVLKYIQMVYDNDTLQEI